MKLESTEVGGLDRTLHATRVTFLCAALFLGVSACGGEKALPSVATGGIEATWELRDPAPLVRQEFSATSYEGRIFVMGNLVGDPPSATEMWWYDPDSREWSSAADLPVGYDHSALVALGDYIYAIGGYQGGALGSPVDDVFAYDPSGDRWTPVAPLPEPRGAIVCASSPEHILCAGGSGGVRGEPSAREIFVYKPDVDTWTQHVEELPTARDHAGAAIVDDVFWVIGGRSEVLRAQPTMATEGLMLNSGDWIIGADLPNPHSGGGLAVMDDQILVFGGEGPQPGVAGASRLRFSVFVETFIYQPTEDRWVEIDPLPTPVHGQAVAVVGREVHSIGGGIELDVPGSDLHQVLVFDPLP